MDLGRGVTPLDKEITDTIETALALINSILARYTYIHAVEQSTNPERAEHYADTLADLAQRRTSGAYAKAHIMRVGRYHDAANQYASAAADMNLSSLSE